MSAASAPDVVFDAWHPGVASRIPREIRHLATIYRPENVRTPLTQAEELQDLTGLPVSDLVAFRPRRLALHELLIRVTADVSIPDGDKIEDLGINFRRTVNTILTSSLPEPAKGWLIDVIRTGALPKEASSKRRKRDEAG